MWSDRDDEEELPADRPSLPVVMVFAALFLMSLAVVLALTVR